MAENLTGKHLGYGAGIVLTHDRLCLVGGQDQHLVVASLDDHSLSRTMHREVLSLVDGAFRHLQATAHYGDDAALTEISLTETAKRAHLRNSSTAVSIAALLTQLPLEIEKGGNTGNGILYEENGRYFLRIPDELPEVNTRRAGEWRTQSLGLKHFYMKVAAGDIEDTASYARENLAAILTAVSEDVDCFIDTYLETLSHIPEAGFGISAKELQRDIVTLGETGREVYEMIKADVLSPRFEDALQRFRDEKVRAALFPQTAGSNHPPTQVKRLESCFVMDRRSTPMRTDPETGRLVAEESGLRNSSASAPPTPAKSTGYMH